MLLYVVTCGLVCAVAVLLLMVMKWEWQLRPRNRPTGPSFPTVLSLLRFPSVQLSFVDNVGITVTTLPYTMYWYLSFLRPPPVSLAVPTDGVIITPQVANDLRTE